MFKILSSRRYAELMEAESAIASIKSTLLREGISNDPELMHISSSTKIADAIDWYLAQQRNNSPRKPIGFGTIDPRDAEIKALKERKASYWRLICTLIEYKDMLLKRIPKAEATVLEAKLHNGEEAQA